MAQAENTHGGGAGENDSRSSSCRRATTTDNQWIRARFHWQLSSLPKILIRAYRNGKEILEAGPVSGLTGKLEYYANTNQRSLIGSPVENYTKRSR